ncbi:MAG: hypothetical protein ACI9C9_000824 [Marivirga sp.]|jgi:hypothetical protein
MKYILSALLLLTSISQMFGQGFTNESAFKEGLYDTFYEFRINKPTQAGGINYLFNLSGSRVKKIIVNVDTLSSFKKVFGLYDGENFLLDVVNVIPLYNSSHVAAVRFSKIMDFGFYSIAEVPTELNVNMVGGGLIPALIIESINVIGKEKREKRNVIVAVHHQTGRQFVVEDDFVDELITTLRESTFEVAVKEKYLLDDQIAILKLYNKYRSNDFIFEREPFYAKITLTRRGKKQSDNEIEIFLNQSKIGVLEKQYVVKADFTEPIAIDLKAVSESVNYQLIIEADLKESMYYSVSNIEKKKEKIDVDKIDFTRRKYVLEEHD